MFRRGPLALTIPLTLASVSAAHAQNFIEDSDMPVANWQAEVREPTGGFAFTVGESASGGNPDAYRTITHTSVAGMASGAVLHWHASEWVPAIDGSIDALDMRVDVNCISGGTSAAVGFGLLVIQDDQPFFGPQFTALNNSGWRTDLMGTNLTETSFVGTGGANPDFSVGGSTISFGFYSSNGTGNGIPINSSSGVDNFIVTIMSTPLPDAGVPPDAGEEPDAGDEPDAGEEPDAGVELDAEPVDAPADQDAEPAPDAAPPADLGVRPDASPAVDLGLRDSGPRPDASVAADAGNNEPAEDGCSCEVSGTRTEAFSTTALFMAGALWLGVRALSDRRGRARRSSK